MVFQYNSRCYDQTCVNCCNYFGQCVNQYSGSSYQNTCYYYYEELPDSCQNHPDSCQKGVDTNALIGGIVGGVFGLIILIAVIVIWRKCKANQLAVAIQNQSMSTNNQQIVITPNMNQYPDSSTNYYGTNNFYPQVYPPTITQAYPAQQPYMYGNVPIVQTPGQWYQ